MNRAIFLDFDGVLHPAAEVSEYDSGDLPLKEYAVQKNLMRWVALLHELLIDHPDVMVIVHSGWRTRCQDYELREFLGPLAPWFAGSAPVGPRYRSIMQTVDVAGIDDFIVLDDAGHEFPSDFDRLIVCDPEQGISCPQVRGRVMQWCQTPR